MSGSAYCSSGGVLYLNMNCSILLGASIDKDHHIIADPADTIGQLRFMNADSHFDTSDYVNNTLISYTMSTWDITNMKQ